MSTKKSVAKSTQKILDKTFADIERYSKKVDKDLARAIVKHLGIAVRSKDASLVSCTSDSELERVRESFLKKKLGLKEKDAKLDKAIQEVCKEMKKDRRKLRTTFYYLLVKKFKKESVFA